MEIIFSEDAKKQYKRLPKSTQIKIARRVQALKINPYAGKKLSGEFLGWCSLRAWPYRILYEINEEEKRIEVHKIVHRQGAYK